MLKFILTISLFIFITNIKAQDTLYAVQVLSTRNVHLLEKKHFNLFENEVPKVEYTNNYHRIIFIYDNRLDAEIMLHNWSMIFKDAFIRTIDKDVRTYNLFEDD